MDGASNGHEWGNTQTHFLAQGIATVSLPTVGMSEIGTSSSPPDLEIIKEVVHEGATSNTSTPIARQNNEPAEWVLHSGSSCHMTGNPSALHGLHHADTAVVPAADGQPMMWSTLCGRAVGSVSLSGVRCFDGGARMNAISAGFLVRQGCEIRKNVHGLEIRKGGVVVGRGRLLPNNQWSVDFLDDRHLGVPACSVCPSPHAAALID